MINTILQSTAGWLRMVFQFVFKRYCCFRGSRPEVFLRKGVLKICRKFTGEHPCRSVTYCNFATLLKLHFEKNAKKLTMKNVLNDQKYHEILQNFKILHTQSKLQGELFKLATFCNKRIILKSTKQRWVFYPNLQGTKHFINYSQRLT